MVSRLVDSGLVQGVHFCTLNLEKSVRTILENIGWVKESSPPVRHNQLIGDGDKPLSTEPSDASRLAEWGLHHAQPPVPKRTAVAGGQSAEDSWDEYPNGRFTDVRSPAYGEIDGWGSGLKTTVSYTLHFIVTSSRPATSRARGMGNTDGTRGSRQAIHGVPRLRPVNANHAVLRLALIPRVCHDSAPPESTEHLGQAVLDSWKSARSRLGIER